MGLLGWGWLGWGWLGSVTGAACTCLFWRLPRDYVGLRLRDVSQSLANCVVVFAVLEIFVTLAGFGVYE